MKSIPLLFLCLLALFSFMAGSIDPASALVSGRNYNEIEDYGDFSLFVYEGYVGHNLETGEKVSEGGEFSFSKKGRYFADNYDAAFFAAQKLFEMSDRNGLSYVRQKYNSNEDLLARDIMAMSDGKSKKIFSIHVKKNVYEKSLEDTGEFFPYPEYEFFWGNISATGYEKLEEKIIRIRIETWVSPENVAEDLLGYCAINSIFVLDELTTQEIEELISDAPVYDGRKFIFSSKNLEDSVDSIEILPIGDWASAKKNGDNLEVRIHHPEKIDATLAIDLLSHIGKYELDEEGISIEGAFRNAQSIPEYLEGVQEYDWVGREILYASATRGALIKLRVEHDWVF